MSSKFIVVADLQHFKIFNVKQDPLKRESLQLLENSESLATHQRIREKVSDREGNFQSIGGSGSAGGSHTIELEEERRRIKEIAQDVSGFLKNNSHQAWCFAAPKAINNKIVELLDSDVRKSMTTNLTSDLTNIPNNQLLEHFSKK
jgi:hypothetical protein